MTINLGKKKYKCKMWKINIYRDICFIVITIKFILKGKNYNFIKNMLKIYLEYIKELKNKSALAIFSIFDNYNNNIKIES